MTEVQWPNRKPDPRKLLSFGFEASGADLTYRREIAGGMQMTVTVTPEGRVFTEVTDGESGEEYLLHRVESATGAFVGQVREAYNALLVEIAAACLYNDVFAGGQPRRLLAHIRSAYGDEPEYLWEKYPDCAVVRRADNRKWYAVILTVDRRRLGQEAKGKVEILDLRISPDEVEDTVDHARYFPAYHMNKKHWITLCLDGSVGQEEIERRVAESYRLAKK